MRPIPLQSREESFSWACVQAVAANAGFLIEKKVQDFGIDGELRPVRQIGPNIRPVGWSIEFQLKASIRWSGTLGGQIGFSVDVGALRYLSTRARERATPMVLLAVCLPPNYADWLEVEAHEFRLRHCCYVYKPTPRTVKNRATEALSFTDNELFTPLWLQTTAKDIQRGNFW